MLETIYTQSDEIVRSPDIIVDFILEIKEYVKGNYPNNVLVILIGYAPEIFGFYLFIVQMCSESVHFITYTEASKTTDKLVLPILRPDSISRRIFRKPN